MQKKRFLIRLWTAVVSFSSQLCKHYLGSPSSVPLTTTNNSWKNVTPYSDGWPILVPRCNVYNVICKTVYAVCIYKSLWKFHIIYTLDIYDVRKECTGIVFTLDAVKLIKKMLMITSLWWNNNWQCLWLLDCHCASCAREAESTADRSRAERAPNAWCFYSVFQSEPSAVQSIH